MAAKIAGRLGGSGMNLRRGLLRLGVSAMPVWFVFWTNAYVLNPPNSHSAASAIAFSSRIADWRVLLPCLVVALLVAGWTVAGFRSGSD